MDLIEVTFEDGQVEFRGSFTTPDGTDLFVDERGPSEHAATVWFEVVRDGLVITSDGAMPLEPGSYVLDGRGLFKVIDGQARPHS